VTQYLLDSGDPREYQNISTLAKEHKEVLFGATTNPSLIAKKLAGKKASQEEAFELQKQIVMEIIGIVPGPVSAEVYADETTTGEQMAHQGRQIAAWHDRIVVKLPTTIEGFKARTILRHENIPINNTLVFSQQQIFACCLHEQLIQKEEPKENQWPPFISPFVGRLEDIGEDGVAVVEYAMRIKRTHNFTPLILLSSVRRVEHIKRGLDCEVDLITSPDKVYEEWFPLTPEQKAAINSKSYAQNLKPIDHWDPPQELLEIDSINKFMEAIASDQLDIHHDLTDKGIVRFADDWKAIIA
jgi:transaldolase